MSNENNYNTSSEEVKSTTSQTNTVEQPIDKPIVTVEPVAKESEKGSKTNDNLQDDGMPNDFIDNEEQKGKPEELKTSQEKEEEAMDEPQKDDVHTNDKISKKALLAYYNGHFSIYMAVAWMYIFIFFVNKDKEYMKKIFDGRTNDIISDDYTKVVNICLKLTDNQRSTASLYKGVLVFLAKFLPTNLVITNDEKCAKTIATFIKDTGGLKVCQKKGAENGEIITKDKTKPMSANDIKRAKDNYLESDSPVGGFTAPEVEGFKENDLIIMIAKKVTGQTDEIEVVDMLTDESLLKQIIRIQNKA